MQQEKRSNNTLQRHIQVLKILASNPSHLQFPSESEDNPQKWEVYRDGHRELPEDIEEEIEEDQENEDKDQENEDDDQENEDKGQEEKGEGEEDENEDRDEAEKKQEDNNEDHPDLVTMTHKLQLRFDNQPTELFNNHFNTHMIVSSNAGIT